MLETLFKRSTTVSRYREAPFSKAREQFLELCVESGYSHAMLKKIAWVLYSIASRIDIQNGKITTGEIEKANLYLADFGDLVRSILDQSSKNQISLAEELETLRTYLNLEQLRFPFKYSITVEDSIIPERLEIPPLFIQPHVENAIIHGLKQTEVDNNL